MAKTPKRQPTTTNRQAGSELRRILTAIATDPDAGEWGEWARRMLARGEYHAGQCETPTAPTVERPE